MAEPTPRGRPASPGMAGLGRASAVMAAGTATSRVLGFVRAATLTAVVGGVATAGADAFQNANTIPNSLYLLIAGGVLNAVLVPQVVRAMRRPDGGAEYLDRLVTAAVVVLAVVTAVLSVAAPLVIRVYAFEYSEEQRRLATAFAYWCLPQVFFYALYTLLGQILNAKGRFGAYMWAPVVNNVVALAGLGAFVVAFGRVPDGTGAAQWSAAQVAVLAGTSTLGVVAQALVLAVPLRRAGVRLRPRWGLRGMGMGSAGRVAGWTFGALLLSQGTALVISNVAATATNAGAPGIATWGVAFLVFMLPHSLVTVSLVTALFTRMSAAAARGDSGGLRADLSTGLRTVGLAMTVATAGIVVTAPAAGLLLGGGDPEQGRALGRVMAVAALGLVPFSATYLVQRGFYALEDARTPFFVQCLVTTIWVSGTVASLMLAPQDRMVGVAAALAVSQWAGALTGLVALRRRLHGLDSARVLRTHVRLLVAGVVATAAGLAVALPLDGLLELRFLGAGLLAAAGAGTVVVVYAVGLRVLHVEEVRPLLRRLPGPLGRR